MNQVRTVGVCMEFLIEKLRDQYYSRVRWYDKSKTLKDILIPLGTQKKSEAVKRNNAVKLIKNQIRGWE